MQIAAFSGIGHCEIQASGRLAEHRDLSTGFGQYRASIEEQRFIDDLSNHAGGILYSGCCMFHRSESRHLAASIPKLNH